MPVTPPPPCVALLAWYEPGDRRAEVGVAGRGAHVEQLVGRELAVEDVAADQARTRAPSRTARSPAGAGSSSVKPGATASTRAITRSAYASSSSASGGRRPLVRDPLREHRHDVLDPRARASGRTPTGCRCRRTAARRRGPRPRPGTRPRCRRATPRARSCRRAPRDRSRAWRVNSGSRSTATFTFTVPLRVFHRSMRSTKSVGQLGAVDLVEERDLRMRRRDHDVGAQLLTRLERHAAHPPVAHVDARDGRVGAHGRAVRERRARAAPRSPRPCRLRGSPTSRAGRRRRRRSCGAPSRTRCRASAARPTCRSRRSPTSTPCICGDANHSSSRSAMLIVNRRVTSPTPRTPSLRSVHASRAWSTRSPGGASRARGGIVVEQRAEHVGRARRATRPSARTRRRRRFENCAICACRRAGSSSGSCSARPSR